MVDDQLGSLASLGAITGLVNQERMKRAALNAQLADAGSRIQTNLLNNASENALGGSLLDLLTPVGPGPGGAEAMAPGQPSMPNKPGSLAMARPSPSGMMQNWPIQPAAPTQNAPSPPLGGSGSGSANPLLSMVQSIRARFPNAPPAVIAMVVQKALPMLQEQNRARSQEIQDQLRMAQIQNLSNPAGDLPDNMKTMMAQSILSGDWAPVQTILGFSKNRPAIMASLMEKVKELAPDITGSQLAALQAKFGGEKAGANVVGRTAGSVAVGAAEIPKLLPFAIEASKKVNKTNFPTVNSIEQAAQKGLGGSEVWVLNQYIQTLKNAYQQIAARGGRITDAVRNQGDALINGSMPTDALIAAGKAMENEAGIVSEATGTAMGDVTNMGTGAPKPKNQTIIQYDAQGNRVQ